MYNIFENLPKSVKHDVRASWIGSLLKGKAEAR